MELIDIPQKENTEKIQIKKNKKDLANDDIAFLKNSFNMLFGLFQFFYRYAIGKTENEYKEFGKSLELVWKEFKRNRCFGFVTLISLISLVTVTGVMAANFLRKNFRSL